MKRIRKIAMVFAVVAIAAMSLSAATWVWSTPYDNVTGYRYQIGSESEEGWIYVDKDVTSLTLDRNEETTIYVQLTVDNGRFWSPSGIATYVPQTVLPVENLTNQDQTVLDPEAEVVEEVVVEAPVEDVVVEEVPVEEVAPVEEVPVEEVVEEAPVEEVVEEEAPVEEVAVVEEVPVDETVFVEAVNEKKGKDFSFGMGLSVASEFMARTYSIQPMLNFNFQNVASPADWFGLDVDWNLIGLFTPDANLNGGLLKFFENLLGSKFAMGGATELIVRPTFMFGGMEFGISLGGGANFYAGTTLTGNNYLDKIPVLFSNDAIVINAYALAGADLVYNFNDTFGMGVGYKFKYIFDKDIKAGSQMSHSAVVSMSLSF